MTAAISEMLTWLTGGSALAAFFKVLVAVRKPRIRSHLSITI
jgi:hypothetical protein